jgi:hypothetical protein
MIVKKTDTPRMEGKRASRAEESAPWLSWQTGKPWINRDLTNRYMGIYRQYYIYK